ncbi:hypothetical protein JOB18_011348 [Solea senegalensis]|uniref:Uncharacterized protein n=1 Tax=Solea senegalensis TaxID=28829 RepID=A0AAV6QLK1_SOLSE|nr:hypothetical protein JOB18_011348 [Solea senegalensis]
MDSRRVRSQYYKAAESQPCRVCHCSIFAFFDWNIHWIMKILFLVVQDDTSHTHTQTHTHSVSAELCSSKRRENHPESLQTSTKGGSVYPRSCKVLKGVTSFGPK